MGAIIIGGGIVGLATALQLTRRYQGLPVTVIEKEQDVAAHQTGHNSGVVHAGVYYAPGSLKAAFCRAGVQATREICRHHGLPYEQRGKLIVATNDLELERLGALFARCVKNGLDPERLDGRQLSEREPRIIGKGAIFVQSSSSTDYPAIARTMVKEIRRRGGTVLCGVEVVGVKERSTEVTVETTEGEFKTEFVTVCVGLHADRMAAMCGIDLDFRIVPFRGEYFRLPNSKNEIVKHLIYPVPDPKLPFLGVHLTPMIGGYVTVGPNAVLAMAREGYRRSAVDLKEVAGLLGFPGFWRVMRNHAGSAVTELKNSLWRRGYLAECRKFCPELTLDDLSSYPAGVRAQAVLRDGTLVHDFAIRRTKRTLHVCNAPSPAATSAIPIAAYLVDQMSQAFEVGELRRQSLLPSSSNAVSGELKIEPVVNAANLTARPSDRVRQTP